MQMFPIPGQAQAKIEDMSRLLLSGVSQVHSNMPTSLLSQVSSSSSPGGQAFAGMGQKLAVRNRSLARMSSGIGRARAPRGVCINYLCAALCNDTPVTRHDISVVSFVVLDVVAAVVVFDIVGVARNFLVDEHDFQSAKLSMFLSVKGKKVCNLFLPLTEIEVL